MWWYALKSNDSGMGPMVSFHDQGDEHPGYIKQRISLPPEHLSIAQDAVAWSYLATWICHFLYHAYITIEQNSKYTNAIVGCCSHGMTRRKFLTN